MLVVKNPLLLRNPQTFERDVPSYYNIARDVLRYKYAQRDPEACSRVQHSLRGTGQVPYRG